MGALTVSVVLLACVAALAAALAKADPAWLARAIRGLGPVALGVAGVSLLVAGRYAAGGGMVAAALGWQAAISARRAAVPDPGRRSTVRTAALEMELDHDTGAMHGVALCGRHDGETLGDMDRAALLDLHGEVAGDPESRQLLDAYLDGRFAGWREHADAHPGRGQRSAPGPGAMTEQEAYQVLGLSSGARAAEIRKAHRRLMQRLHPDFGGSSILAARINEAKDVLLSLHH